ncbi:MAG: hypothetical protein LBR74_01805 [Eubacterium sp.]|jgi:hypothetical protein|nr:hypothetical protein [Eubacterium sp.]
MLKKNLNASYFSRICAVIAMAALCALFVRRASGFYTVKFSELKSNIESQFATPPKDDFLKNMFWDYLKHTNRNAANGVIIMNDGRLVLERISAPPLLAERAEIIIELSDYLQAQNTPFLFLRAPDPMRDNADMPKGFENTVIEDGARFLSLLNDGGVDALDLRAEMTKDYEDFSDTFYWGDHHWNVEGALWAFGKVGAIMNRDYSFQLDKRTWNPQEYEHITLNEAFIGYASNRVGRIKEDITVLIPKFDTNFVISNKFLDGSHQDEGKTLAFGSFLDVFAPAAKDRNKTSFSYENLNVVGSGLIKQYVNLAIKEDKKVLLLSDSFAYPFVTYLATAVKNVDYLYLAYRENQRIYSMLKNKKYDLVLYLAYDGTILEGGTDIEKDRMYLGEPH